LNILAGAGASERVGCVLRLRENLCKQFVEQRGVAGTLNQVGHGVDLFARLVCHNDVITHHDIYYKLFEFGLVLENWI